MMPFSIKSMEDDNDIYKLKKEKSDGYLNETARNISQNILIQFYSRPMPMARLNCTFDKINFANQTYNNLI